MAKQVCLWLPFKLEKPKTTSVTKIRKTALLLPNAEKSDAKNEKPRNRSGQQNRKTKVFQCKNRKIDLKSGQNWKTKNSNTPLLSHSFNNNNNNNNNIHLYSAFLLVIQSALQSVLIAINLIKYYNDS